MGPLMTLLYPHQADKPWGFHSPDPSASLQGLVVLAATEAVLGTAPAGIQLTQKRVLLRNRSKGGLTQQNMGFHFTSANV